MKFIYLLLLSFSVNLFAQNLDSQQYSKAKILIDSNYDIKHLIDNGIAADHGNIKKNTYIESVFSLNEIEKAKSLGYSVEVIIEDMKSHYMNTIRDAKYVNTSKNAGPCDDASTVIEYETPTNFNLGSMGGFLTYTQILSELDDMQSLYPDLISVKAPIGTFESVENRPIYWVKISDNPTSDEAEPEMLYTAIHHAREPGSVQQLIFYMWYLLENYASDTEIQTLVDNTEIFFVPVINVDGYIYNETTDPNGGGMWRKNRRDNGDGTMGVDLNRNYSYHWGESGVSGPSGDTYPGTQAFSEPETQAIKWFCEQRSFVMALNNHTYSNLLLYPFGYADNQPTVDDEIFQDISSLMVSQNGYTNQISADLYPAAGDSDDWMYGDTSTHDKIFAMTPEIGSSFWPAQSSIIPLCKEMMFLNITAAKLVHNYAEISDNSSVFLNDLNGNFEYTITRLGLEEPANFTVSVVPVSTNIASVGTAVSHNGLNLNEEVSGGINYTLDASISEGDEVQYKLVVNNGLYDTELEVTRVYGTASEVFSENGDTTNEWTTSDWGVNTSAYVSASSSITDSPSGNYGNNENNTIFLTDIIDLATAVAPSVSFYCKWDIESNYDYVQFEVSIDNGSNWIPQCGKYTNTGVANQNNAEGEPLYDGTQTDWVLETVDLSDYIGSEILFRFSLVSDSGVTEDGFYFDDLSVKMIDPNSVGVVSDELENYQIFPNPASDSLTIISPENSNGYSFDLTSITGQIIKRVTLSGTIQVIDISDIAKGIYFIKLYSGKTSKVIKFVKD